jgi:hypothetical protein
VNWPALARAVIAGRIALGYDTQKAFANASRISLRIVSDLETGKRTSYSSSTLARLERALGWPDGRVEEHLRSDRIILIGDSSQLPPLELEQPDGSWLSTPEGIDRHLHRDDLPLVALLHRAGLTESDLFRLILKVRARREIQNAALLQEIAAAIRDLGGWAPERVYPPLWLVEDNDR